MKKKPSEIWDTPSQAYFEAVASEEDFATQIAYKAGFRTGHTQGQAEVLNKLMRIADERECEDLRLYVSWYAKNHKISTDFNV